MSKQNSPSAYGVPCGAAIKHRKNWGHSCKRERKGKVGIAPHYEKGGPEWFVVPRLEKKSVEHRENKREESQHKGKVHEDNQEARREH